MAIKVVAEAEDKPAPISDVSLAIRRHYSITVLTVLSSTPLVFTQSWSRISIFAAMIIQPRFRRILFQLCCNPEMSLQLLRQVRRLTLFSSSCPLTISIGSGKTAAYLIPAISKLMGKVKKYAARRPNLGNGYNADLDAVRAEPLIVVVAPTRELCCQIFDEARRLCYRSMLRPCVAYGGGPLREQRDELRKGCDILVATPGRLLDFMSRPDILSLARVR